MTVTAHELCGFILLIEALQLCRSEHASLRGTA
jgi:hypothetical protein